ncbi:SRPBCC family protein [Pseudonocardia sp. CA-107938]|uniref:SRPBCC family protein n=1 Tax=Pseudonocardia sp. CA-107938 TaxID=3240021 RepID=UPI003D8EDBC9
MTTLENVDGRSVLRMQRRLAHPVDRVWQAVTEPAGLAAWFPSTVEIDLRVGGAVTFGFGPDGTVTDLDPPRVVAFTWGDDHLRFELAPDGPGTVLHLVHTFDDHAGAASFAAGWDTCLAALDLDLDGKPVDEHALDHEALHERYLAEFGLDEPAVRAVPDGWQVRVERQLVRPAEVVEPLLPAGADGVEWRLGEGTGHGARLVVTWTGSDPAARDAARADLPRQVRELAATLAG